MTKRDLLIAESVRAGARDERERAERLLAEKRAGQEREAGVSLLLQWAMNALAAIRDEEGGGRAHDLAVEALAAINGADPALLGAALERERDGLRATLIATSEHNTALGAIVAEQKAQISGLLALLENHPAMVWITAHGQHPPECGAVRGDGCNCGLDALRRPQ